jgi:hypothetical protein
MDIISPSNGITREAVVNGAAQSRSGNPGANLVIEDLEEFTARVYTICGGTAADYVFHTPAMAA